MIIVKIIIIILKDCQHWEGVWEELPVGRRPFLIPAYLHTYNPTYNLHREIILFDQLASGSTTMFNCGPNTAGTYNPTLNLHREILLLTKN